jgi:hypothetical protein
VTDEMYRVTEETTATDTMDKNVNEKQEKGKESRKRKQSDEE